MSVVVLMKAIAPSVPEGHEMWHFDVLSEGGRRRTCEALYREATTDARRRKAIVEWVAEQHAVEAREVRYQEVDVVRNGLLAAGPPFEEVVEEAATDGE